MRQFASSSSTLKRAVSAPIRLRGLSRFRRVGNFLIACEANFFGAIMEQHKEGSKLISATAATT